MTAAVVPAAVVTAHAQAVAVPVALVQGRWRPGWSRRWPPGGGGGPGRPGQPGGAFGRPGSRFGGRPGRAPGPQPEVEEGQTPEFDNMAAPTVGGVKLPLGDGQVIRLARGASPTDLAEKIDVNPASLVAALFALGESSPLPNPW